MNNPDHFSKSLETIYGLKYLYSFWCGSGIRDGKNKDPWWEKFGPGIRDKNPGSATLNDTSPEDGIDVLEQADCLVHGGRHELLEVRDGEALHNLVAQLLPHHQQERDGHVVISCTIDKIILRTPNPKCRLSWCLIEFIGWRYSQSCWYFRPPLWTSAPLTFSLVHLPPLTLFLELIGGLLQIKTCRQVPRQIFKKADI